MRESAARQPGEGFGQGSQSSEAGWRASAAASSLSGIGSLSGSYGAPAPLAGSNNKATVARVLAPNGQVCLRARAGGKGGGGERHAAGCHVCPALCMPALDRLAAAFTHAVIPHWVCPAATQGAHAGSAPGAVSAASHPLRQDVRRAKQQPAPLAAAVGGAKQQKQAARRRCRRRVPLQLHQMWRRTEQGAGYVGTDM
jgi:hypothetical protein